MPSASPTFGPYPCAAGNIVTLTRSDGMRIPLHRELVPLSSMLIDVTEARGHNLPAYGTWGAACRFISGTKTWSNHARGCAIDFDAPNNPYASAAWHRRNGNAVIFGKRVRCNIPQWVFELWEAHGFYCGVRYGSKPDPMHFEYVLSVDECRTITKRLQDYLKHPGNALPQPTPPPPPVRKVRDMFLARVIHTKEVYLFEPGRYTHMKSRIDLERIAASAGISKSEAEIGADTFDGLIRDRKRYS